MQESLDQIRNKLWDTLHPYFDKYAKNGEVANDHFETMFRDIFADDSQQDVHYVIKNMHRLDRDGNGSVDFPEFVIFQNNSGQLFVPNPLWINESPKKTHQRPHEKRRRKTHELIRVRYPLKCRSRLPRRRSPQRHHQNHF